jgi:putative ATP-binding cassette transporter
VPFVFVDLAMVIGSIVYVTWLSWQVAAFLLVVMVVTLTGYQWVMQQAKRKLTLARAEQDHLFKYFRAITDGIKELKLNYLRRQAFLREDLQTAATTYRRYNVEGLDLFAVISSIGSFILFFMIGLVLFALPNLLTLDLPTLSSYTLVFVFMLSPMENLTRRLPYIAGAEVALNKIESLNLSLTDRSEIVTIPATVQQNWQSLRLQGVTHAYGSHTEDQFILGSIDLSFHPGEIVFIVGGNGSGKSTLAKLITGLYIPESGSIDLDGRIITVENREWYRQHFAAIFADFYLFDRLLGMKGINLDQQAQSYLKQLHLDRKVTIENGILSTTALSQGQRKRLALLTAYLEDRPIYLFDEWAADQDPSFKELFYTKFLPELRDRGKTILVISHDDHYFHVGDRIIKLDYGKVEYDKQRNQ